MNRILPNAKPDKLAFDFAVRPVRYGDKRTFHEYQILIKLGSKVVGVQDGPRRETSTNRAARRAAEKRIEELRSHRLFAVSVKRDHISDGKGRDCFDCAIAQALYQRRESFGFDPYGIGGNIQVSPYAAWREAEGLVFIEKPGNIIRAPWHIPADRLPKTVTPVKKGFYVESMVEWAMRFDDWEDSRYMSLKEWREERGYNDGERPYQPKPCSFVLDLDAFVPFAG